MTDKSEPIRTLERKKREAEALKANLKRRKAQPEGGSITEKEPTDPPSKSTVSHRQSNLSGCDRTGRHGSGGQYSSASIF